MAGASSKRRSTPRKGSSGAGGKAIPSPTALTWANEALSVLFYAFSAFLLISFFSNQINSGNLGLIDPAAFPLLRNPLGPVGKFVGTVLSGFMGWCALVPAAWAALLGKYFWDNEDLMSLEGKSPKLLLLLGVSGILLFSCTLSAIFWGGTGGGSIGLAISAPLMRYFSVGGATLIAGALFLLSTGIATRRSVAHILESLWEFSRALAYALCIGIPRLVWQLLNKSRHASLHALDALLTSSGEPRTSRRNPSRDTDSDEDEEEPFQLTKPKSRAAPPLQKRVETIVEENEDFSAELAESEREDEEDGPGVDAPVTEDASRIVVKRRDAEERAKVANLTRQKRKVEDDSDDEVGENPRFPGYELPEVSLLTPGEPSVGGEDDNELREKSRQIESKLKDFGIYGKVTQVHPGPVITLFEFEPAPGVKVGKIAALQDDLAMSLRASSLRIIAPIPKRGTVGIEVPNKHRDIVRMRDVLESEAFLTADSILSVPLGKDTYGDPVVVDIATMPHLLMAGATGTGKSVCINAILVSLLYRASPADLGLILIDPKILELSAYDDIPHLRVPVVTDPRQAKGVLQWAVNEMNRRYKMMQRYSVRNIDAYNSLVNGETPPLNSEPGKPGAEVVTLPEESVVESGTVDAKDEPGQAQDSAEAALPTERLEPLQKIVIVIDELADLMLTVGRDIEELITRLAQKARAAGIHLIIATQRPSVDVITGLIKANFPARLSFRVTARVDSRTILDQMGADKLLGRGDMLFLQPGAEALRRVHGAFISDSEVKKVVDSIKAKAKPQYDERILEICQRAVQEGEESETKDLLNNPDEYDAVYDKAVEFVLEKGHASTSMIQRAFRIGYNRAARIVDMMEKEGIVGPSDGAKPREVIVPTHDAESGN